MTSPDLPLPTALKLPGALYTSRSQALFERINAALPQTQCTRCGYPDCAAYAQAIASDAAAINQCPPGGAEGVQRLAVITGRPPLALNPSNGLEGPRTVAIIDEAWCIGCTLCIKACPTDAILGSNKMMHTVIEPYCTGCELCVPVCPVDCISLEDVTAGRTGWDAWSPAEAQTARRRYEIRSTRRPQDMAGGDEMLEIPEDQQSPTAHFDQVMTAPAVSPASDAERKRAAIESAMAKARARRNNP